MIGIKDSDILNLVNPKQKEVLAEKLMDIANFSAGALLIGQIIAKEFSLAWTIAGGVIWIAFYSISLWLLREGG